MPSKRGEASKQLSQPFPTDLPPNTGFHEARFFLDPRVKEVKSTKEVTNVYPDGSTEVVTLLSYSMLVEYEGNTHCCYVAVRDCDFIEGGHPGDGSMEREMDRDLAKAKRGEFVDTITILASHDYTTKDKVLVKGKFGRATLA